MHKFRIIVVIALLFSLTGCTTQYYDIHQQIQPGMRYKEISDAFGKEGERYTNEETEPQTVVYQWYVDDYLRVIMYFSSADQNNDPVLYKYDITYGCSFIKEGMTYRELAKKIGKPDIFEPFSSVVDYYAGMMWKIHDYLYLTVTLKKQDNDDREYVYPDDYIVISFSVRTTDTDLIG